MIEIKNTWTGGFEGAIRGMRNPYESHKKSDSVDCRGCELFDVDKYSCGQHGMPCPYGHYRVGEADMALCKRLIKAGTEHRKFLRMIHVQADVTAPRYWWAEAETYSYLLRNPYDYTRNSSSTMHLITKRPLTLDDFSRDGAYNTTVFEKVIESLNTVINLYNSVDSGETKEACFRAIKQLLPESYNQMRTIDTNYECLLRVYGQRKNHRLSEWRDFCNWIESLPYMKEFINACS